MLSESPQKITPESLGKGSQFSGFGYSISSGKDVDGNGRPDLAVGSVISDKAVVLRTREVVRIRPESYSVAPFKAVDPKTNGEVMSHSSMKRYSQKVIVTQLWYHFNRSFINSPAFEMKINAHLSSTATHTLDVTVTFTSVDERIQLPPDYRRTNSTRETLLKGLK